MGRNKEYRKLINTRKWQKLRLKALSKTNYLCAVCLKNDITTPAINIGARWSIELSGTELVFKYNGVTKQRLLSDGSIVATG